MSFLKCGIAGGPECEFWKSRIHDGNIDEFLFLSLVINIRQCGQDPMRLWKTPAVFASLDPSPDQAKMLNSLKSLIFS